MASQSVREIDPGIAGDRRSEPRHTLILRVGVLDQGGRSTLCIIKNISTMGLQFKFYSPPIANAVASIRIADEFGRRGSSRMG